MRELLNDDMYLLSEMIDKMNLTIPSKTATINGKSVEKTDEEYGAEIITKIIGKIYLAKNQVNQLLANVTEKPIEEIQKMKLKDTVKTLTDLISNAGVTDFFK